MSLILIISLITVYNKTHEDRQLVNELEVNELEVNEVEVIEVGADKGVGIGYARKYEEDIFGDLSKEEIDKIIDEIFEKVSKNDKYKENTDLAIEEVFKEYGITDENKLEAAKKRIVISLK